jgi:hypothetical protein
VVRTRAIQYGPDVFRALGESELVRLDDDALMAANVHQITSRFRRALREALDTG